MGLGTAVAVAVYSIMAASVGLAVLAAGFVAYGLAELVCRLLR